MKEDLQDQHGNKISSDRISIGPYSQIIQKGDTQSVNISIEIPQSAPLSEYTGNLTISWSGGTQKVKIWLYVKKEEIAVISIYPSKFIFGFVMSSEKTSSQQLRITNAGNGILDWTVTDAHRE